ncbi:GntR family transcriptional regulator [Yersinia kristensenii]|uniref:GntR family transcriptional regulator n=1 Tax=Yersinia kristensenii TaxID=28152 RepID=A0AB73QLS0_YERKR|nr:GntR family transcriptional regulator [Yersinia kristensenii]MDA5472467.1 GntR family transcriptional regulator [Yersinia kristensenii]MDA5477492.1 GntR family transcriptional regulator [Yersinia kristensenii]MDA5507612.1 GntR family transcriptional regulator [Yersinia kristensenii]NIK97137.1 GntR family transcriptional regulator [Yersinia kristensenii]NIL07986.1 GntR family transcriptional regulator [Yersinia kristensenii]
MVYAEVVKCLRDRINSLEYKVGDIFPSEQKLALTLNISRNTLRKAMTVLVDEGLLEKRHGSGTYIRNKNIQPNISALKSFSENAQQAGKNCTSKVLKFMVIKSNADISSQLRINLGDQVYYIRRLRFIEDKPVQLEDTWMSVALFPDLSLRDMVNSKFAYIEMNCGMTIAGCYETFMPVIPDKEVANLLNISLREPALQLTTQAIDINGVHLDYSLLTSNVHEFRVKYFWPRQRPDNR